jgi:hypothetical protein
MALRAILILALLIQQLAVWPCVSVCRMMGSPLDASACHASPQSEPDCPSPCAQAVDACTANQACGGCASARCQRMSQASIRETARSDATPIGGCDALCWLACEAAQAIPHEQGPAPAPATPHIDLVTLLALPVAFISWLEHDPRAARMPGLAGMLGSGCSSWSVCQLRSMLCRWLI